jgi:ferredoxin
MPLVVTGNCDGCKFTTCVAACPADCFCEDARMVYIDPAHCINCRACLFECPVNAIYDEPDLPPHLAHWAGINREKCFSGEAKPIGARKEPLPTAEARRRELGF